MTHRCHSFQDPRRRRSLSSWATQHNTNIAISRDSPNDFTLPLIQHSFILLLDFGCSSNDICSDKTSTGVFLKGGKDCLIEVDSKLRRKSEKYWIQNEKINDDLSLYTGNCQVVFSRHFRIVSRSANAKGCASLTSPPPSSLFLLFHFFSFSLSVFQI